MSKSNILEDTFKHNNETWNGSFVANTAIGFDAVSFSYDSHVTYKYPYLVISQSNDSSTIFNKLYSKWEIKSLGKDKCEVEYFISMTMSNPLYMIVTRRFFDLLATTMHESFSERCQEIQTAKKLE